MDPTIPLTQRTLDNLQHVRFHSKQIARKERKLNEITRCIGDDEARIKTVLRECKDVEAEDELQEAQRRIEEIGSNLPRLDEQKAQLTQELQYHNLDLTDARECVQDEIFRVLLETGQLNATDASSNGDSELMEGIESAGNQYPHGNPEHEQGIANAGGSHLSAQQSDYGDLRARTGLSVLDSAKENLQAAAANFHQYGRICDAQRRDFERHAIPDLSRTEFDLEQLTKKIELTKELIQAEQAYSEAGRYAVEVGFVREDSHQSCHFLEDADDGACSGDMRETFIEPKQMNFIETWRENIGSPCSERSAHSQGDRWEVDSVNFGEGCSTHADEWSKKRIDRFEESRQMQREEMHRSGVFACADELVGFHTPTLESPAMPFPAQRHTGIDAVRAGLWKPSFEVVKELLVSGQAAMAKFSAPWSSQRGTGGPYCG